MKPKKSPASKPAKKGAAQARSPAKRSPRVAKKSLPGVTGKKVAPKRPRASVRKKKIVAPEPAPSALLEKAMGQEQPPITPAAKEPGKAASRSAVAATARPALPSRKKRVGPAPAAPPHKTGRKLRTQTAPVTPATPVSSPANKPEPARAPIGIARKGAEVEVGTVPSALSLPQEPPKGDAASVPAPAAAKSTPSEKAGRSASSSGERLPVPAKTSPVELRIPGILLEGDEPVAPRIPSPPATEVKPQAPTAAQPEEKSWQTPFQLPESYGTGRLSLRARDPRSLHAHWDVTNAQQRHYRARARDGRLVIRVHEGTLTGPKAAEIPVQHLAEGWFVQVQRAGKAYIAEVGYYESEGEWHALAVSETATTPSETVSEDTTFAYGTVSRLPITPEIPEQQKQEPSPIGSAWAATRRMETPEIKAQPLSAVPTFLAPQGQAQGPGSMGAADEPPSVATPESRRAVRPMTFSPADSEAGHRDTSHREWTAAEERALEELVGYWSERKGWAGSAEIAELLRRAPAEAISSAELAPPGPGVPAITSPLGPGWVQVTSPGGQPLSSERGFWFNVNAELVIYGATEPNATVSIGGRPIRLRPDGTFSYRFSLPDGQYTLPIQAVAVHGDTRRAELSFERETAYSGSVEAHPQDPALKPPVVESIA